MSSVGTLYSFALCEDMARKPSREPRIHVELLSLQDWEKYTSLYKLSMAKYYRLANISMLTSLF